MHTKPPPSSSRLPLFVLSFLVLASALVVQVAFSPKRGYLWSNIKNLHRPLHFHGHDIQSNFFEGWYFKMVSPHNDDGGSHSMAIIPGLFQPDPATTSASASSQSAHAFVMVFGLTDSDPVAYYRYPKSDFVDLTHPQSNEAEFKFRIGNNIFAHDRISLDLPAHLQDRIPQEELESFYTIASQQYQKLYLKNSSKSSPPLPDSFFKKLFPHHTTGASGASRASFEPYAIQGHFHFPTQEQTPLPTSWLVPSIMGITAYAPFLECNHGISSLYHPIQKGLVSLLQPKDQSVLKEVSFDGGVGYIEKDWGVNFPSTWIWIQANIFRQSPGSSLLFSLASIPALGPDVADWIQEKLPILSPLTHLPGRLIVFYHAATKTLYNFSSYQVWSSLKSLSVTLDTEKHTQTVSFVAITTDPNNSKERIGLQVNITRSMGTGVPLRMPSRVKGSMVLGVEESIHAETFVKLWQINSGQILLEDSGLGSGLEVEGDVEWLEKWTNTKNV